MIAEWKKRLCLTARLLDKIPGAQRERLAFIELKSPELSDFRSSAGLPVFGEQSANVIKMIVAGRYSKLVLLRGCRDPDIIFRNWSTLFAKEVFDFSVMLSRFRIATENSVRRCELIHCLNVRLDASGLSRTVIQLAEDDA